MKTIIFYVLMTSQALMRTSRWSALALQCPDDENAMFPEDPFVFYGDILRLCCNVTKAAPNVTDPDDVIFYRLDTAVTGGQVTWGAEAGTVCWENPLEEEEEGERRGKSRWQLEGTFYYCRLKPVESRNETHGQCLGYQSVQSDRSLLRAVQRVKIGCVTGGGQLQCQWPDISDRFLHPDHLALPTFYYGHTRATNNCSVTCDQRVCRSCRLQQGADFQLNDSFELQISVQWRYIPDTRYGSPHPLPPPVYHNKTVSPQKQVKLSAPKDVTATSPQPQCIQLTWLSVGTGGATTLIYRLTVQAEGVHSPVKIEEFAERNMSVTSAWREMCELTPFTVYNLSLTRRADYSDVWSDVIHTTVQTLMAPPDQSPEIGPGYLIGSNRQLTIYWKPIPENSTNGPDVRYMVNTSRPVVKEGDDSVVSSVLANSTDLSFAVDSSQGNQHIVLHVQAVNRAGPADNASRLSLDLASDGAKDVRGIVENETKDLMTLNITWRPEHSRDYSYTVHWCLRRGYNSTVCQSELQWQTVNRAWYVQRVPRTWLGRLLYGVSLNQHTVDPGTASGFRFHVCLYHRKEDGALQMLYSPGCEETPKTYTGSGQPQSLAIAVSVTFGLIVVAIGVVALRNRCLHSRGKFSPTLPQSEMDEGRTMLTTFDISPPLMAPDGSHPQGLEETKKGTGEPNGHYTPADPRHRLQYQPLITAANHPPCPPPLHTHADLPPNASVTVRLTAWSQPDQAPQMPYTSNDPHGTRASRNSPKPYTSNDLHGAGSFENSANSANKPQPLPAVQRDLPRPTVNGTQPLPAVQRDLPRPAVNEYVRCGLRDCAPSDDEDGEPVDSPEQTSSEEDADSTDSGTQLNMDELLGQLQRQSEVDDASSAQSGSARSCPSDEAFLPGAPHSGAAWVSGQGGSGAGFPQATMRENYVPLNL